MWKKVPMLDNKYEVSDTGDLRRCVDGLVLSKRSQKEGYIRYRIGVQGGKRDYFAHVLVADAFIGPKPHKWVIDHINTDRSDNRLSNIEYVTHRENVVRGQLCKKRSNRSSRYVGVTVSPKGGIVARKCVNGKHHHIGSFKTEEDAHQAYLDFEG